MARGIFKLVSAVLAVSAASISMAQAGGFGRGTADTDILYEEGNFDMRAGVVVVVPNRKFSRHGNPALVGTNYTAPYMIPSGAIKMNITDDMRCAATFVNSYGGHAEYEFPTLSGKISEQFSINEYAMTCGYKFDLAKGRVWVLGGLFADVFDYERANVSPLGPIALDLEGVDPGFRIGAAYEIPEIALRAQLMYRSSTTYGAEGNLNIPAGLLGIPLPPTTLVDVAALGRGTLPQSLEMKLQSGIAPGWLAFGSVKWTDWSATTSLDVISAGTGAILSRDLYNWKDGWTVTAGVGHAFNDQVSGAVSLTWDQGVSTGFDLSSDTWTLGVGGSFKDALGGELRAGVGLTYISGAEETRYGAANSAVDSGMAYAFSGSYKVKW
jgi:long-chain fatty acid transport protein